MTEAQPVAGVPRRLLWSRAEVVSLRDDTPRVRSLTLAVADWPGHLAGQHVDVRLTAEDGYQAQRSYSIASPPEAPLLELTVETISDGEVSPYLTGELRPGDIFELRGPIGGYFVWSERQPGPLVLIGGGSGVVPLMAMLRHRAIAGPTQPALLVYSSRNWDEIIYRDELERLAAADPSLRIVHTLTRAQPQGWQGFRRRVDKAMLEELGVPALASPNLFICGPTPMVETAAQASVELGIDAARIKTERFGPSGG
ncbi:MULTISPECIES: ferredoxin reductase [Rhodomicrobium]|uniref:ferredoxin reductase n=1 Tax=Rhodomicrobium TaxID=1068 RepID=UPI001FD985D1|nr:MULTISPECIES: ferredoxin reductase [Rhodomicrobium]